MNLTRKDIEFCYAKIKKQATVAFEKKQFNESLEKLATSAEVAYNFSFIYKDSASESLLKNMSTLIIKGSNVAPAQNRVVFYDAFGWDNRGLTQQYVRALKKTGVEFLFIYERKNPEYSSAIDKDLSACGSKVQVYELEQSLSKVEQIRQLHNVISDYAPAKAFLHIAPWSVVALSVFYAFPQIVKYNINLTDHAFWLGSECIDYNIEFRNYGYTVSVEKRGLRPEQCICLPYYPIVNNVPFKGFPMEVPKDKVIVFSGGALYKIYGKNGSYFNIVKRLLNDNPNIIMVYAGDGERKPVNRFIKENKFENRLFLLGNRVDINEVFKACDIYLGTFPLGGGLMSQYAAVNGKPILAYSTQDLSMNFIEGIVCHRKQEKITCLDYASFFEEAKQLCSDGDYRMRKGESLKQCVITPLEFNAEFEKILSTNTTSFKMKPEKIDFDQFSILYLEVENRFQNNFKQIILSRYGLRSFLLFPLIMLKTLPSMIRIVLKYAFENKR